MIKNLTAIFPLSPQTSIVTSKHNRANSYTQFSEVFRKVLCESPIRWVGNLSKVWEPDYQNKFRSRKGRSNFAHWTRDCSERKKKARRDRQSKETTMGVEPGPPPWQSAAFTTWLSMPLCARSHSSTSFHRTRQRLSYSTGSMREIQTRVYDPNYFDRCCCLCCLWLIAAVRTALSGSELIFGSQVPIPLK